MTRSLAVLTLILCGSLVDISAQPPVNKERKLTEQGWTAKVGTSIEKGLEYLSRTQLSDGSWGYDGSTKNEKPSATAMALLTFLYADHTHVRDGKYRDVVKNGLVFVLKQQTPKGNFQDASTFYSHAFITMSLCEALARTGDAKLIRPAQAAIDWIEAGQGPNGSWGYSPGVRGDTSITGWVLQALLAGKRAKLKVSDERVKLVTAYLDTVASKDGEKYGYTSAESPSPSMTAVGLYSRRLLGWKSSHPAMFGAGATDLKKVLPNGRAWNAYTIYYATNLFHSIGGDVWSVSWNPPIRDFLIGAQLRDGSWEGENSIIGQSCGRHGTTCFALMTLGVYHRGLSAPIRE